MGLCFCIGARLCSRHRPDVSQEEAHLLLRLREQKKLSEQQESERPTER